MRDGVDARPMRHHVMDYTAGPCLLGLYIVVEQYDVVSLDLVILILGCI